MTIAAAVGFKEWIIPQDRAFFDLLERHADLAVEAVAEFSLLLANWNNIEIVGNRMKDVENRADDVGHEIFDRLSRTFITPIDREDIARLAHSMDDVVDAIYAATNRIVIYEIPSSTRPMHELLDILRAQTRELAAAMKSLRRPKAMAKEIPSRGVEIHRLENLADRMLNQAVAELFKTNDAVRILKYKEVYDFLEAATDRCEDVADVMYDILRKHG